MSLPKIGPTAASQLVSGLMKMNQSAEGSAALDAVRLEKFVPLDAKGVAKARAAYAPAAAANTR